MREEILEGEPEKKAQAEEERHAGGRRCRDHEAEVMV
jgi:hypothetical protein